MEPSALEAERHPRELADRPHRVVVTEQQHLRPLADLGAHVVAGGRLRQPLRAPAELAHARGDGGGTAIQRGLVVARRLEAHEVLDGPDEPVVVAAADGEEIGWRGHACRGGSAACL